MKRFVISLLSVAMSLGSLFADDPKKTTMRGRDDLRRYVAAHAAPGGQTTFRGASGRTLGTARTVGTRTTFRDQAGRTTGTASVEGGRTVFRDASGRTVGTATFSAIR